MGKYVLELSGMESSYGLNHVVSKFGIRFLSKNFFVLAQNLSIDAQTYATIKNFRPYLMIRTTAGQCLQQTIGVKDDASHRYRVYAYALRPIVR